MRLALTALAVLVLLAGCVPDTPPSMHDVYVYGTLDARLSYFYGKPGAFLLDGRSVTLSEGAVDANYAVAGSLLIDGRPFLRQSVPALDPAPIDVSRIPLTTDLQLSLVSDVDAVVYFDGRDFFTLADDASGSTIQRVTPRQRLNRLRGLGQLTDREADALADALTADGAPFALAVLPASSLPTHTVDGLGEVLRTGLYVQTDLETDVGAYRAGPEQVPWEPLATGTQAVGFDQQDFMLVRDQARFIDLWNRAYGSQLQVPALPSVDFSRETVVAVFVGQQSTGGYSVSVRSLSVESGDLYVDLTITKPNPGSITTQALTSPWVMIRVLRGGFGVAWFRDADSGSLLGVARRTQ